MDYEDKLNELLQEHMTEDCFNLWKALNNKIPSPWNKPTSSTGKYHKKKNGYVPSIAEHTLEMVNASIKIYSLFNLKKKTIDTDLLLIGIAIHDIIKYGNSNDRKYTDNKHDQLIANRIQEKKNIFLRLFNDEQVNILIEMVRYHSGRWSTDANKDFDFKSFHPYVLFLHTLDMLSSRNCLKIGEN